MQLALKFYQYGRLQFSLVAKSDRRNQLIPDYTQFNWIVHSRPFFNPCYNTSNTYCILAYHADNSLGQLNFFF